MTTSRGIVAFNGVTLDDTTYTYRKAGQGSQTKNGRSRLIDLGGGGTFDPDAGQAAPKTPYQITESYRIQGTEAQASTQVNVIENEWMESGTLTTGNAGTYTGRLISVEVVNVKTGTVAIYDVTCTWEIIP